MPTPLRKRKEAAWELLTGDLFAPPFGSGGGASNPYEDYVNALAPEYWRRYRETSGTVGLNSGSLGGTTTWTPGAGALGQIGQLGANEAYDFDGALSKDSFPITPTMANAVEFGVAILNFPDTLGETTTGILYCYGDLGGAFMLRYSGAAGTLVGRVDYATDAITLTSTALPLGAWSWIFANYSESGDRKLHLYRGVAGVVTEFAYTTNTASVGAFSPPAVPFVVGAQANQSQTWDGKIDEVIWKNRPLTATEMLNLTLLSGLAA